MRTKFKLFLTLSLVFFTSISKANNCASRETNNLPKITYSIPLAGNAYSSKNLKANGTITNNGIENWTDYDEYFTVYFKVSQPGNIQISVDKSVEVYGESKIEFSIKNDSKVVVFNKSKTAVLVGDWKVEKAGYIELKIKGKSKKKSQFPSINRLNITRSDFEGTISYVPNNEGEFYHWGRRGPSVHLSYQLPERNDIRWFYNELTIPENQDKVGSYFMANGFGEGYFGIQVNSETERRILFSVWSPFSTDDPDEIPKDQRVNLIKKGENVQVGEFGNEGSGGQSYLKYNWKSKIKYKFLLKGCPETNNSTTYTAYFFSPELDKWLLIASFNRPETSTYLTKLHSFLENFIPEQGNLSRKVLFENQWICNTDDEWLEINKARFTTDNTGIKEYRMDFAGGVDDGAFYLENGGFFDKFTTPKTIFTTSLKNRKPDINLNTLP